MRIDGLWRSRGYGWTLRIEGDVYRMSHLSRGHCVLAEEGSRAQFDRSFDRIALQGHGRMTLHQAGDLTRYTFERFVPPHIQTVAPGSVRDPLANLETLWETFDEHYAFFDLHRVDWNETGRGMRARVTAATTEEQLLKLFSEMLLPLEDGHVSLSTGSHTIQTLKVMDVREAMRRAFGMPTPRVSPRSTVDAVSSRIGEVLLDRFAGSQRKQACNGIVSWCRLTPRIGYLSVLRLFGFAASDAARTANDLPLGRPEVAAFLEADMAALEAALDEVMTDLADCDALILDLRINGGGFDRAGMAIANRFADAERIAFTKRARDGVGFTPEQSMRVMPRAAPGFTKPVYVMTSPLCVSAGEICVLSLKALPQVRTIGESTAGVLSDNLNKILPNGWTYSLSNEIYAAADGGVYEGCGIAPDVAMPVTDASRFVETMRQSLQRTVAMAEGAR